MPFSDSEFRRRQQLLSKRQQYCSEYIKLKGCTSDAFIQFTAFQPTSAFKDGMAKQITGFTGCTGANEGDGLRPTFLHFFSRHQTWLIQQYAIKIKTSVVDRMA